MGLTLPLVFVFGFFTWLCVRIDKARLHHLTIAALFGLAVGVSFAGGEIWAVIVQIVRWAGAGLMQAS